MLQIADTTEELATSLASELKARDLNSTYADQISKLLVQEYAAFEMPRFPSGTLGLVIGRYAIRKDDVRFFESLTEGLKAAAGVGFFTDHQPALAAKIALGVAVAKLARGLMNRGVKLDVDAIHILTILKCNTSSANGVGLSAEDILTIIQRSNPGCVLAWVESKLDYLSRIPTRDGAGTTLASCDGLGKWRSHA